MTESEEEPLGFHVSNQKIFIDVDIKGKFISGWTEITIVPTNLNLSFVNLDCRQCEIHSVMVNNIISDYKYLDFKKNLNFPNYYTIEHYQKVKNSLNTVLSEYGGGELLINFPKNVKVEYKDKNGDINNENNENNENNDINNENNKNINANHLSSIQNEQNLVSFAPITLKIEFSLSNPLVGLNFISELNDSSIPHVYTSNEALASSTSFWVPCIDGIWERCTWELEFSIPRNVKNLLRLGTPYHSSQGSSQEKSENNLQDSQNSQTNLQNSQKSHNLSDPLENQKTQTDIEDSDIIMQDVNNESITNIIEIDEKIKSISNISNSSQKITNDTNNYEKNINQTNNIFYNDDDDDDDNNNDEYDYADNPEDNDSGLIISQDLTVICCGDFLKEIPHPEDSKKKIISYVIGNPTGAQHISFAIGPFSKSNLSELDDQDEYNNLNGSTNSTDVVAYYFSSQKEKVINTCLFMPRAMSFFIQQYGSYPFTSFSLVFIQDFIFNAIPSAGVVICNEQILFPPDIIDPIYSTTKLLTQALAAQWSGINIVPKTYGDFWLTIGISYYIANQFLKKLMGTNEYRFRLKKDSERIIKQDIRKPPLAHPLFDFPVIKRYFKFMALKAPIVLFILDRRMLKIGGGFGLSRVIPKIFLQGMSGGLLNDSISTNYFIRVCEKVSHTKLDNFFKQWVYGSGYPIFRVTQRFNKKKMFIEVGIRQVQSSEISPPNLEEETFVDEASLHLKGFNGSPVRSVFTGLLTIRIHEADGTPYEHVVELKDEFTRIEIPYNTKYKRLKRARKQRDKMMHGGNDSNYNSHMKFSSNDVLLHSLGDILQSEKEIEEWRLSDFSGEEEDRMSNEAFEWIRLDADFEWIAKMYINQPDYMFLSQLQQDRDVIAQYESIKYYSESNVSQIYSSILVRTLMDQRYYYGIRVEAARALAKEATMDVNWIGSFHLQKAFVTLFCFENSLIPISNNFIDFASYFVKKEIPLSLSNVKDSFGETPYSIKLFLLDLLIYNDNATNMFSDCYYIKALLEAISNSIINPNAISSGFNKSKQNDKNKKEALTQEGREGDEKKDDDSLSIDSDNEEIEFDFEFSSVNESEKIDENKAFIKMAIDEINKCLRMDNRAPSYKNIITCAALRVKEKLYLANSIEIDKNEMLNYTQQRFNYEVRVTSFISLLVIDGLKSPEVIEYFFATILFDSSQCMKNMLLNALLRVIGIIALNFLSDAKHNGINRAISITEASVSDSLTTQRREILAQESIANSLEIVRKAIGEIPALKHCFWGSLISPFISVLIKRDLLKICSLLYRPAQSLLVSFNVPKSTRIVAREIEKGHIVIKKESLFKINLPKLTLDKKVEKKIEKPRISLKLSLVKDKSDEVKGRNNEENEVSYNEEQKKINDEEELLKINKANENDDKSEKEIKGKKDKSKERDRKKEKESVMDVDKEVEEAYEPIKVKEKKKDKEKKKAPIIVKIKHNEREEIENNITKIEEKNAEFESKNILELGNKKRSSDNIEDYNNLLNGGSHSTLKKKYKNKNSNSNNHHQNKSKKCLVMLKVNKNKLRKIKSQEDGIYLDKIRKEFSSLVKIDISVLKGSLEKDEGAGSLLSTKIRKLSKETLNLIEELDNVINEERNESSDEDFNEDIFDNEFEKDDDLYNKTYRAEIPKIKLRLRPLKNEG